MKILLTGSAGFIGHHVLLELVKRIDYEIIGIDNLSDYYDTSLKISRLHEQGIEVVNDETNMITSSKFPNYIFLKLDLINYDDIITALQGENIKYIIHLAAQPGVRYSLVNPHSYISNNISVFVNILEFARLQKVKHLIYASSSSVYGLNQSTPFEEFHNTDHPGSLYGATKKSNEVMAHSYSHLFQIPTTGLRFFTVYGPFGRPDMAPMIFARSIMEGKEIDVYNFGNMIRDFTFVEDVAQTVVGLIPNFPLADITYDHVKPVSNLSSAPYSIYNVGNSSPVQLLLFIKEIEKNLNRNAVLNLKIIQPGEMIKTFANSSLIEKKLNIKINTSMEQGVRKFIAWYISYFHGR